MGYADKVKSGSGSAVEGKITGYAFYPYFPLGEDQDPDGNIYLAVEITPDGADEPVTKPMYLGSSKYLVICDEDGDPVNQESESGPILKGGEDGEVDEENVPRLYEKGNAFKFISSLEEAGFPAESVFPDPSEEKVLDFRAMIGWRIRLGKEQDVEGQLAAGKKKLGSKANGKSQEEILEAGKSKVTQGKHKGKSFNLTFDKVIKVFSPDEEPAKAAKGGKTAKAAKETTKAKGKAAKKDDEEETTITAKAADKMLVAVVSAQPKKQVDKKGLLLALTRYCAKNKIANEERDAYKDHFGADDFAYLDDAAEREVIALSKKGIITVADDDEEDDDE